MTDTKLALLNEMYIMSENIGKEDVSDEYLDSVLNLLSSKLAISETVSPETQMDLLKNLTKFKQIDMKKRRKLINQFTVKNAKNIEVPDHKDRLNYATAKIALEKSKSRLKEHFKMPEQQKVKELKLEVPELLETLLRSMAAKSMLNTFQIVDIKKEITTKGLDTTLRSNFNDNELVTIREIIDTLNKRYKDAKQRTEKLY